MGITLYLICAALGSVLLVTSLIGDMHHDHAWFSLRGPTYFLAFFGLTGVALNLLTDAPLFISAAVAASVGVGAAAMATTVFKRLMAENKEGGGTLKSADVVGCEAVVVVPCEPGSTGRVRLAGLSNTVEMLCTSDGGAFAEGERVLVADVKQGIAMITKLGGSP